MQRGNWFLAADLEGKWITTGGYAEVTLERTNLTASLKYDSHKEGDDPYHIITATIDADETVDAIVSSPGRHDIERSDCVEQFLEERQKEERKQ